MRNTEYPKAHSHGSRQFDKGADAEKFMQDILADYPPVAYGTSTEIFYATSPSNDIGNWYVKWKIWGAD